MKTLFETLTVLALILVVAISAMWLLQSWNVVLNGAPVGLGVPVAALVSAMILALGLVIGWNFEPGAEKVPPTREATRDIQRKPALAFTVKQGKRYRANISLGFFEQVASNDMIGNMLEKAGFTEVSVTGSGASRRAEATWSSADATAEMPPQIVSAAELPGAPTQAAAG